MSEKLWHAHQYLPSVSYFTHISATYGYKTVKKSAFTCGSYRAESGWVGRWHQVDKNGYEIYLPRLFVVL